jgi:hypothetical protein
MRTQIFAVVTAATAVTFSLTASAQARPVGQVPRPLSGTYLPVISAAHR